MSLIKVIKQVSYQFILNDNLCKILLSHNDFFSEKKLCWQYFYIKCMAPNNMKSSYIIILIPSKKHGDDITSEKSCVM